MKKIVKVLVLILALTLVFCSCTSGTYTTSSNGDITASDNSVTDGKNQPENDGNEVKPNDGNSSEASEGNLVKFTMEKGGSFIIELYPQYAPETVENFKNLVSTGFYDGLTFHRVMEGFMAQGGDPEGTGYGGSGKNIKGEFRLNDFIGNTLSHTRGVVSMARSQDYDSASSQFFICYDDASFLDGQYAAFGKVIEGMEVVDSFLEVERRYSGRELSVPVEPIVIESAVIVE